MSNTDFGFGQMQLEDATSETNIMAFIARQVLAGAATMKLVQVKAVHPGSGAPPAAGTVDVQPLVKLVDGNNNATPYGTIFGVPFVRIAGGKWQIVVDPAVNDVGLLVCADRDSSAVAAAIAGGSFGGSIAPVTPGSFRKFDLADGVYLGGLIPASAPSAYFWLNGDGTLKVSDANGNVLQTSASGFALTGNVVVNGTLEATGNIKADGGVTATGNVTATGAVTAGLGGADQVGLQTHTQSGVSTGAGVSGPPTPGS